MAVQRAEQQQVAVEREPELHRSGLPEQQDAEAVQGEQREHVRDDHPADPQYADRRGEDRAGQAPVRLDGGEHQALDGAAQQEHRR